MNEQLSEFRLGESALDRFRVTYYYGLQLEGMKVRVGRGKYSVG